MYTCIISGVPQEFIEVGEHISDKIEAVVDLLRGGDISCLAYSRRLPVLISWYGVVYFIRYHSVHVLPVTAVGFRGTLNYIVVSC